MIFWAAGDLTFEFDNFKLKIECLNQKCLNFKSKGKIRAFNCLKQFVSNFRILNLLQSGNVDFNSLATLNFE